MTLLFRSVLVTFHLLKNRGGFIAQFNQNPVTLNQCNKIIFLCQLFIHISYFLSVRRSCELNNPVILRIPTRLHSDSLCLWFIGTEMFSFCSVLSILPIFLSKIWRGFCFYSLARESICDFRSQDLCPETLKPDFHRCEERQSSREIWCGSLLTVSAAAEELQHTPFLNYVFLDHITFFFCNYALNMSCPDSEFTIKTKTLRWSDFFYSKWKKVQFRLLKYLPQFNKGTYFLPLKVQWSKRYFLKKKQHTFFLSHDQSFFWDY